MKAFVFEDKATGRRTVFVAEQCTAMRSGASDREPALFVRCFDADESGRPAGDIGKALAWNAGVMPTSPEEFRELLDAGIWCRDREIMGSVLRASMMPTSRKK